MLKKAFINIIFSISMIGLVFQSCEKTSPSSYQKEKFIKFYSDAYFNEAVDMEQADGLLYLLVNHTNDDDERWVVLRCVDNYGNRKWEKRYGNEIGDNNNWAHDLVILNNGNIAIVGTEEIDQDTLFTDIKLTIVDKNQEGIVLFDSVYNDSLHDEGFCLAERMGGGYLVLGCKKDALTNTTIEYRWVLDNEFNLTKKASNFEIKYNMLGELELTDDGKKFLPGNIEEAGRSKAFIGEIDDDGKRNFGFPAFGSFGGFFNEVKVINFPKMIACGFTESGPNGGTDGYLAMIDYDGQANDWSLDFGGVANDDAASTIYTSDDNILLTGKQTIGTQSDIYVLKVNNLGVPQDTLYFGGKDNEYSTKILPDINNPNAFFVFGTSSRGDYSYSLLIRSKF